MHMDGWSPSRRSWVRYRRICTATQYTWSSRFCLHQRTSYNCHINRHISVVSSRWSARRLEPCSDAPATPLHNICIFMCDYARHRQSSFTTTTTTIRIVIDNVVCRRRRRSNSSSGRPSVMSLATCVFSLYSVTKLASLHARNTLRYQVGHSSGRSLRCEWRAGPVRPRSHSVDQLRRDTSTVQGNLWRQWVLRGNDMATIRPLAISTALGVIVSCFICVKYGPYTLL